MALVLCLWAPLAAAQGFTALARVDVANSEISDVRGGALVQLALSQAIPYRLYTLESPRRLVLDFREVDWTDVPRSLEQAEAITTMRYGRLQAGWSRMVLELATPLAVDQAEMRVDEDAGTAVLSVRLVNTDAEGFAATAGLPLGNPWGDLQRQALAAPRERQTGDGLIIALDPGHGGIDSGAVEGGVRETELMLLLARELRDQLRRSGDVEVVLTRDADVFVPLDARMTRARAAGADVFVSLHADSLAQGYAEGASVYALSVEASDQASEILASRHSRGDILAGVDLTGADDEVAMILMDMARIETAPRSAQLGAMLIAALGDAGARLNSNPTRAADFAVLRSADIPSVLVEVGFLSSEKDRIELQSPEKRARIVLGLANGILDWAQADAADAGLIRQ